MVGVNFAPALKRFFPDLKKRNVDANSIVELLFKIELIYPGIKGYIVDDQGSLRKHVNIFINNYMVKDRAGLEDKLNENDEVYFIQALSGG